MKKKEEKEEKKKKKKPKEIREWTKIKCLRVENM